MMVMAMKCDCCGGFVGSRGAISLQASVPAPRRNCGADETLDVWEIDVCLQCVNCKTLAQVLKDGCQDIRASQLRVRK